MCHAYLLLKKKVRETVPRQAWPGNHELKWGVMCRFPNGESGADVYDRMTIFEDHLVRDINAGEPFLALPCRRTHLPCQSWPCTLAIPVLIVHFSSRPLNDNAHGCVQPAHAPSATPVSTRNLSLSLSMIVPMNPCRSLFKEHIISTGDARSGGQNLPYALVPLDG